MADEGHIELDVKGREQLKALIARLRAADNDLRLGFLRSVRAAIAPLKDDVRRSAHELLPKRGGFAATVEASKFSTRTSPRSISFAMTDPFDLTQINRGELRHPVFQRSGRKITWVTQQVPAGFWTTPIEKAYPEIRVAVERMMADVARQIENG